MPTNQYGQTEWDADPETAAELRRLSNQEKMAAAMMKNGQQSLAGGMVGNTYVGASPLQGLANMFHQYNSSKATQGAEEGYKNLAESRSISNDNERGKIIESLVGRPEQPMGPPTEAGEMGVSPAQPAGSRADVMRALAGSRLPAYRDAGLRGMIADKTGAQDSPWAKIDPKDYTPESLTKFALSKNPAELIGNNKPAPEKRSDQIAQYEYAKTPAGGNYKGTFSQFKTLGPSITAAAMAPLRETQVGNINAENAYNLPPNSAAPRAPKVGQVVDGYKFKGGDPANQSNWRKL